MFHSFSHLKTGPEEDGDRELNLESAILAQQELFRKWDVDLSDSEENKLVKEYITPEFESGSMNVD